MAKGNIPETPPRIKNFRKTPILVKFWNTPYDPAQSAVSRTRFNPNKIFIFTRFSHNLGKLTSV